MNVLITGASRGIGKELCEHFSHRGEKVFGLSGKDCNLAHWDQTFEYFNHSNIEDIDLIIHCAAINMTKFFHKISNENFRKMIDVNIMGTFNLLQCAIPRLKKKGNIILFSSAAAFAPRIGQAAYSCCKSALHGLVKALVQELLVEEKYIFIIAPGLVEVGMSKELLSTKALEKAHDIIPMKRFCTVEELVNTVDFLCATPYMTGQTIHINGAYYIH